MQYHPTNGNGGFRSVVGANGHVSAFGLSARDREDLHKDLVSLLSGTERFSIVKHAYRILENWTAVSEEHKDPEIDLFKKIIGEGRIPKVSEMVHLGVGDVKTNKAKSRLILNASGAGLYVGVDFSPAALEVVRCDFAQNMQDVTTRMVEGDFFRELSIPARLDNPLLLCDGITFGNAPAISSTDTLDDSMIRTGRKILNAMGHRGHALITLETDNLTKSPDDFVRTYLNDADRKFTLSILEIAHKELGMVGIEPGDCAYDVMWDKKEGAVNIGFHVNGSGRTPVYIPGNNPIEIEFEDARIAFTNRSARPTLDRAIRNLKESGFQNVTPYFMEGPGITPQMASRVALLASATP